MRMHFIARGLATAWPDLAELTEDDVDAQAARFRGGVNNWIIQTFLRLRAPLLASGITPTVGEALVPDCVNVAHRDSLNRLFAPYYRSFVVGIRADRPPVHLCDLEIVQNPIGATGPRTHFLNFWPQPGLIPRDPARGSRIERMAYFGRASNAPAWFSDPAWHEALAGLGITFEIRDDRWFDYSDVDVVLAHRTETPTMLREKPASKLTNAWLAGVPALLANEPAYACLRRSGLDYIAIDSPADVLDALRALRACPRKHEAMAANGRRRGVDFSVTAVKAKWLRFVAERIVPEADAWRAARNENACAQLGQLARTVRQKLDARIFKRRRREETRVPLAAAMH
jgi:hypothetical protein